MCGDIYSDLYTLFEFSLYFPSSMLLINQLGLVLQTAVSHSHEDDLLLTHPLFSCISSG